jgi:negative regulator of flagellin synthesis FlgM
MSNDISRINGSGSADSRSNAAGDARGSKASRPAVGDAAGGAAGSAPRATPSGPSDAVTLSADASKIISLEAKLRGLPEIDQPRVDRIRTAIANGDYHVDPRRVAQKFLELDGQL